MANIIKTTLWYPGVDSGYWGKNVCLKSTPFKWLQLGHLLTFTLLSSFLKVTVHRYVCGLGHRT